MVKWSFLQAFQGDDKSTSRERESPFEVVVGNDTSK